jgi:hypothetical protein
MSKRQQIVTALTNLFQTVKVVNSYGTDLGLHVFPWRREILKPSEVPGIVFWDLAATESESSSVIGLSSWDLNIEVVGFFPDGTTATDARKGLSDLVSVIGSDETLSGLLDIGLQVTKHELGLEPKTEIVGMVHISLKATYSTTQYSI